MDIDIVQNSYPTSGAPSHHPKMMLKVLIFACPQKIKKICRNRSYVSANQCRPTLQTLPILRAWRRICRVRAGCIYSQSHEVVVVEQDSENTLNAGHFRPLYPISNILMKMELYRYISWHFGDLWTKLSHIPKEAASGSEAASFLSDVWVLILNVSQYKQLLVCLLPHLQIWRG